MPLKTENIDALTFPIIFNQIFGSSPTAIAVSRLADGVFVEVNDSFLKMHEYSREEVLGHTSNELKLWTYSTEREKILGLIKAVGHAHNFPHEYRTKSGAFGRALASVNIIEFGGTPHLIGFLTDISELNEDQLAFLNSANDYHGLFNNMLNGFAYCHMLFENGKAHDFVYLSVNKSFETQTGLKNVVGRKVSEVIPGILESNPELIVLYGQVASSGKSDRFETYVAELNIWLLISVYSPERGYFVTLFDNITKHKEDVKALSESEDRFRLMFENILHGVVFQNQHGQITLANQKAQDILGLTLDQMQGRTSLDPLWRCIHEDGSDFPGNNHPAIEALKTGKPVDDVVMGVFNPKINQTRWINVSAVPLMKSGEHKPTQVFATFLDITESRLSELALIEKEERYRAYVDQAADALFVHDFSGRFVEINQQACDSLGYSREELLRLSVFDVEIDFDLANAQAVWRQIQPNQRFTLLGHQRRKDGSIFPVEVRFGFFDNNGSRLYMGLVRDITERKQMETALANREKEFRLLAEAMPQIVWITKADGSNTYFNKQWVEYTGLTLEESIDDGWNKPFHPDDRQRAWDVWHNAVKNEVTYSLECRLRRSDGEYFWWLIRGVPVINDEGKIDKWFGTCTDIHEIKLSEQLLYESKEQYRSLVDNLRVGLSVHGPNSEVLRFNDRALELLGLTAEQFSTRTAFDPAWKVIYEDGSPYSVFEHPVMQAIATCKPVTGVVQGVYRPTKQDFVWLLVDADPKLNEAGEIIEVTCTYTDITERKNAEKQIKNLAHFDQLTGLPNRTLLIDHFKYAFSLAQRSNEPMAVMFLDLDHFKDINDTLGHSIGDQVLMEAAKRLKTVIREQDTLSRQGGDEFILILPSSDADGAAMVASKLIEAVSQPCVIEQHELIVTPSIGIAIYPEDGTTLELLSKNADAAMYRAKQGGRNNFRFYTPEMQAQSSRNLTLANSLRHAVERNEMQLNYQPQFTIQDGHIIGVEALLRWQHPELGMVSPSEFIPIAENSGQIISIGEWVLRTAVRQLKHWIDIGLSPMVMAVNLSAVQFRQYNLPELVTEILDTEKLPHQYLELELTEAAAMDNPQAAIEMMDRLHERGIRMSIDDFGTGYSSLSYLKKFKVYKLKIDQSFVRDITEDPEDKAIVTAIISMANGLGLQTIAEGVETYNQLAFLRMQGCNEVQGYYFSKPLTADQVEGFVKKS